MYSSTVIGPKADEQRIPGIDVALADGDSFRLGETEFKVYDTPGAALLLVLLVARMCGPHRLPLTPCGCAGHTRGHCTFYAAAAEALFPGDTLFAMGCGRLFEGTPRQMWASLSKLLPLPPATLVFCAHEYTQSNAK